MIYFLITLLIVFSSFTAYVFHQTNLLFAFPPFDNLETTQIFCDLVISSGVCLLFIYKQRKKYKLSIKPFYVTAIGVIVMGSHAIILYLIWDHFKKDINYRS
ncbi:MAG: hypothetical protein HOJ35_04560 [Bdellovibrionales bacterium]|jgi:hypothetical protein|nr:hypothetical protein [Bdellovibrionales bacterium]